MFFIIKNKNFKYKGIQMNSLIKKYINLNLRYMNKKKINQNFLNIKRKAKSVKTIKQAKRLIFDYGGFVYKFLPLHLKNNQQIALFALICDSGIFKYLPLKYRSNRKFIEVAYIYLGNFLYKKNLIKNDNFRKIRLIFSGNSEKFCFFMKGNNYKYNLNKSIYLIKFKKNLKIVYK